MVEKIKTIAIKESAFWLLTQKATSEQKTLRQYLENIAKEYSENLN